MKKLMLILAIAIGSTFLSSCASNRAETATTTTTTTTSHQPATVLPTQTTQAHGGM